MKKPKTGHGVPTTPRGGTHKTDKDYHRNRQRDKVRKQIKDEADPD